MLHSSTGHTPFQLMHGRVPTFPVDLVFPVPESGDQSLHSYVEDRVEQIQRAHQKMREIQQNVAQRSARLYNPRDAQRLKVGMRVWYFTPRVWGPGIRKLQSSWGGPYRIVREIAPALFAIRAEPFIRLAAEHEPEVRERRDVVPFIGDLAFVDSSHELKSHNGVLCRVPIEVRKLDDLRFHGDVGVGLNLSGQICSVIVALDCWLDSNP